MNERYRVYVAGAYNAMTVLEVLDNMRRAMLLGKELLLKGFAPYCPHLDYQYQLLLRDDEKLDFSDYYEYGLTWLEVADAVLVVPYSEESIGTQLELKRAKDLDIPIFGSIEEIVEYRDFKGGF